MTHEVTLSWPEVVVAAEAGRMRQISSKIRGLVDQHGFDGLGWDVHIEGACGEMCVARHFNVYWYPTVDTFKFYRDVYLWEVRTRSRHHYDLLIRPKDDDGLVYIHVTGRHPTYRLWGWMAGHDAKRDQFLKGYGGRPPAYFVPASQLRPLETIPGGKG